MIMHGKRGTAVYLVENGEQTDLIMLMSMHFPLLLNQLV